MNLQAPGMNPPKMGQLELQNWCMVCRCTCLSFVQRNNFQVPLVSFGECILYSSTRKRASFCAKILILHEDSRLPFVFLFLILLSNAPYQSTSFGKPATMISSKGFEECHSPARYLVRKANKEVNHIAFGS